MRPRLLLIALLSLAQVAACQTGNLDTPQFEQIPGPLSDKLRELGIGLIVSNLTAPSKCEVVARAVPISSASLKELEVLEAALFGHALYLDSDPYPAQKLLRERIFNLFHHRKIAYRSREWRKLTGGLRQNGYLLPDYSTLGQLCVVAIPQQYDGTADETDALIDQALAPELQQYMVEWDALDAQAAALEQQLTVATNEVSSDESLLQSLEREKERLAAQILQLQQRLGVTTGFTSITLTSSHEILYDPTRDFLRPVLQRNLIPLPPDIHVAGSAADRLTDPRLADALERFQGANEPMLREMGLFPLRLVSTARTPINQLSLQSNPIAAGVFTSGHTLGVAVDMQISGSAADIKPYYDNSTTPDMLEAMGASGEQPSPKQLGSYQNFRSNPKAYRAEFEKKQKNWDRLRDALAGSDLVMKPGVKDANHMFLGSYVDPSPSARSGAAKLRLKMLGDYLDAMQQERQKQLLRSDQDKKDLAAKTKEKFDLDDRIKQAQAQIEKDQKQLGDLNKAQEERDRQRQQESRARNNEGHDVNNNVINGHDLPHEVRSVEVHSQERPSRDVLGAQREIHPN